MSSATEMQPGNMFSPEDQPDNKKSGVRKGIASVALVGTLLAGAFGVNKIFGGDSTDKLAGQPGVSAPEVPDQGNDTETIPNENSVEGEPAVEPTYADDGSEDGAEVEDGTPEEFYGDIASITSEEFAAMSPELREEIIRIEPEDARTTQEFAQAYTDRYSLLLRAGLNKKEYAPYADAGTQWNDAMFDKYNDLFEVLDGRVTKSDEKDIYLSEYAQMDGDYYVETELLSVEGEDLAGTFTVKMRTSDNYNYDGSLTQAYGETEGPATIVATHTFTNVRESMNGTMVAESSIVEAKKQ